MEGLLGCANNSRPEDRPEGSRGIDPLLFCLLFELIEEIEVMQWKK